MQRGNMHDAEQAIEEFQREPLPQDLMLRPTIPVFPLPAPAGKASFACHINGEDV